MSSDRSQATPGPSQPDEFWPRFWFNVCSYSEYYFMLLIAVTIMAVLNAVAMLLAEQSTASFVIATMVFVILGLTALAVGFVLWQCKQLRGPDREKLEGVEPTDRSQEE
ncbi:hypothetical protein L593_05875 [Salinarchaeum sp. Harcht-Bsk1]|uniref:hypothetical protein n=1 Tax=Salinarchaeum sp. Harcht-Bsk1 TaxID=1333523 RepID=UPI0003422C1A|nr:hypothetical protein [Salinarchaeum sp. Harcht-Bsk1]AGN01124.1 hypothetical protein L593_05875 [Salinarchaeum sp. Harcht-Bsk1]